MARNCKVCGTPFQAKRPQAKYCGQTCRKRAQRGTIVMRDDSGTIGPKPGRPGVTSINPDSISPDSGENSLIQATRNELEAANVLDTMLGQQALCIATQMSGFETAGGMASLSKELSRVMAEAMRSAVLAVADPVDELAARRDAKLAVS